MDQDLQAIRDDLRRLWHRVDAVDEQAIHAIAKLRAELVDRIGAAENSIRSLQQPLDETMHEPDPPA